MVKNLDNAGKFLIYLRFIQVFLDNQLEGMSSYKRIYVTPSHTKKIFANIRRQGKDFSGRETPLCPTMVVQTQEEMGEGSAMPTDPHHTPIITQPSSSQPQKKHKSRRPKEKDTQVPQSSVPSDPTNVADEDSMTLKELMDFCTKLQQRVLDLENTKTAQAQEITSLKKRVKKLEKKGGSRTHKLKRLYKVGRSARIVSSDEASLGDQEDASKQGRKIDDIDKDAEITLVDETQGRHDDDIMFDVSDLAGEEVFVAEQGVPDSKKDDDVQVNTAATTVSTTSTIPVSAATITNVELTLAQTLAELKSARPKTKGVVMQEPSESTPTISLQLPSQVKGQGSKDKGKAKMIEPEKPLKKKDQIKFDEEEALRLQAKFDEEDRLAREKAQQVEEANIAWDDIQAKIDADYQLAERLQAQEQQELTIEEKSTLFVQLLEKRKKHFAAKRAEEKRNRPPTRAQQRSIMCTYLKNMAGWKPRDLKNKSFANIQELFDKAMKRVNTFVDMDTDLVEGSEKMDDDQEAAKMKEHIKIVPDEEEVAVDAIPLATKPPSIMLKSFNKEDLETLWKLVKFKHGYTRPEEGYERVLWDDLKTMFEHHVEDAVWRNLRECKVLVWKLFDSCGVHFVRFQNMHVFMFVEKRYPLTSATITDMLNKRMQWRIVGIKRLNDDFRVTAAKVLVTAAKHINLCHDQASMRSKDALGDCWVSMKELETQWKLVKANIGHTRLEEGLERVFCFLSSSQSNSRINEVFGSILLVIDEAFNEET
ncbi:hypothetical protein Tco_1174001, partial [Tanacetum coccineum]